MPNLWQKDLRLVRYLQNSLSRTAGKGSALFLPWDKVLSWVYFQFSLYYELKKNIMFDR